MCSEDEQLSSFQREKSCQNRRKRQGKVATNQGRDRLAEKQNNRITKKGEFEGEKQTKTILKEKLWTA